MKTAEHPLVSRYLDELTALLADLPQADRMDTVAGVREHLDASLGPSPGDADVRRALAALGDPRDVASAAYTDGGDGTRPVVMIAPTRASLTSRAWLPVMVGILQGLAVLTLVGAASMVAAPPNDEVFAAISLVMGVATLPFYLPLILLVGVSRLWTDRERVIAMLVVPVLVVIGGFLSPLGAALVWLALCLASVVPVVWLTRRALRRVDLPVGT